MRIIGGEAGGRRLRTPRGPGIRPTSDRVKEALFNILTNILGSLDGCSVLDIFAGTGNLGIEALSRGALRAVFVDNSRDASALIEKNLEITGFTVKGSIINRDFNTAISALDAAGSPFRLIFLDPPYSRNFLESALERLGNSSILETGTVVVAELSSRDSVGTCYGKLSLCDKRVYGDTALAFFMNTGEGTP